MRRVLVLRPEPGASATVERARRRGLEAIAMPLFEIEPVTWDAPDPGTFDALLLTSAHAVGEATADAARNAGFVVASTGDGGVDTLLALLDPKLKLLHLCGEYRTSPTRPRQEIIAVTVYRSAAKNAPEDLSKIKNSVLLVHSPRAGSRLREILRPELYDWTSVA